MMFPGDTMRMDLHIGLGKYRIMQNMEILSLWETRLI